MKIPKTDFDSPWKEAIETFFPHFMLLFFPEAAQEINWQRGYEFLDKELQQISPKSRTKRKHVDQLVKVWLPNGTETWLLIHLEVQSQPDLAFPERMFIYHYRLFDRYRREVVSLAVLGDDRPDWRPASFGYGRWGCRLQFGFGVVKLWDCGIGGRSWSRATIRLQSLCWHTWRH